MSNMHAPPVYQSVVCGQLPVCCSIYAGL